MSSPLAVTHLAEIVPLPFLRRLVVRIGRIGVSLEQMHQRVAPFTRVPRRLQVEDWEEEDDDDDW